MGIRSKYVEAVVDTIMKIHPEYDKEEVKKIVNKIYKEELKDPTIVMDNNVTGEHDTTTFTGLCNWIDKRNPVISGNATFYKQPSEEVSPTSFMLRELKAGRKKVKKEMFKYDPISDEYANLDLDQQNKKVIMNAEYGGSGTPTAAFYTKYSPPATTLMAQSIITTMAALFEGLIGDNYKFFSLNECVDWMNILLTKKHDHTPDKWISIPTRDQVKSRIKHMFYMGSIDDFNFVDKYIDHCNQNELIYLYYANNMKSIISNHLNVLRLFDNILNKLPILEASENGIPTGYQDQFSSKNEYNSWMAEQSFLNPYKPPECISKDLNKLVEIMYEYVYVEYLAPDSIVKLNNHKRNTVLLVDTDSNMLNVNLIVSYVLEDLLHNKLYGRKQMYNELIITNTIAVIIDKCVKAELDYYGRTRNMNSEARAELTMKNEFVFLKFFLMLTKKRYASSIVLREGNIMVPYKLEIKGMDFIKADIDDNVSAKFTNILKDYILFPDTPDIHGMMKELKAFEKSIYYDLKTGGTKYLKSGVYKSDGYKNPWVLQTFRGSVVWNELDEEHKINMFDRVRIIKTIVTDESNLNRIKSKFPEIYNRIINNIFRSKDPNIRKTGLSVICLPPNVYEIPEWLRPLVDYDLIISNIIGSFRSVTDALKVEGMEFKTESNNKANALSCLISL